jgi:hypothetical protein
MQGRPRAAFFGSFIADDPATRAKQSVNYCIRRPLLDKPFLVILQC